MAGEADTRSEAGAAPRRRISRGAFLATAAAVVGLLGGLAALFDWFQGKVTEPPPPVIDAFIERAELMPTRQTLGDYMHEQRLSIEGMTRRQLREEGLIFLVRVELKGNLHKTMYLRWRLYRGTGHPVAGSEYDRVIGEYTPQNQDQARRAPLWLPYPPHAGRYYARFTLIGPDRKPIDDAITKAFVFDRVPEA